MKCERCGREINHFGRCLPCNYLYKHKAFFPGLKASVDYDINHGMDVSLVDELIKNRIFRSQVSESIISDRNRRTYNKLHAKKVCLRCNKPSGDRRYLYCTECFRFIKQYAYIKSYKEFLEVFGLNDCIESKDNYIEFVDDMNQFFDLQEFDPDSVLSNPERYLEKVTPRKEM